MGDGAGDGGNVGVTVVGSRVGGRDGVGVGGTAQRSPFQTMQQFKPHATGDHATSTASGACVCQALQPSDNPTTQDQDNPMCDREYRARNVGSCGRCSSSEAWCALGFGTVPADAEMGQSRRRCNWGFRNDRPMQPTYTVTRARARRTIRMCKVHTRACDWRFARRVRRRWRRPGGRGRCGWLRRKRGWRESRGRRWARRRGLRRWV